MSIGAPLPESVEYLVPDITPIEESSMLRDSLDEKPVAQFVSVVKQTLEDWSEHADRSGKVALECSDGTVMEVGPASPVSMRVESRLSIRGLIRRVCGNEPKEPNSWKVSLFLENGSAINLSINPNASNSKSGLDYVTGSVVYRQVSGRTEWSDLKSSLWTVHMQEFSDLMRGGIPITSNEAARRKQAGPCEAIEGQEARMLADEICQAAGGRAGLLRRIREGDPAPHSWEVFKHERHKTSWDWNLDRLQVQLFGAEQAAGISGYEDQRRVWAKATLVAPPEYRNMFPEGLQVRVEMACDPITGDLRAARVLYDVAHVYPAHDLIPLGPDARKEVHEEIMRWLRPESSGYEPA